MQACYVLAWTERVQTEGLLPIASEQWVVEGVRQGGDGQPDVLHTHDCVYQRFVIIVPS